jgi:hypothetical protein
MGDLINMALPKPKKGEKDKGESCAACDPGKEPKYPWGLELRLGDDEIKKLGLKIKDFDTDTVVRITAKAECTRVSEDDTRNNGKSQTIAFQVTDMSIVREGEDDFKKGWDAAGAKKGGKKPEGQ